MLQEKVFNIFLFCSDEVIHEIGVVPHERGGTDAQKLAFLQSQVNTDLPATTRYPVPPRYILVPEGGDGIPGRLRYARFQEMVAAGRQAELFEDMFKEVGAPRDPLMCVTPIVDGRPRVEGIQRWS